ncbi:MAG: D-alanyl-D-alanine carboxypeptidase [Clostridia bacterium]|nr:D-alanyl-D-alanine carboxypeptidase [Clostridia bacterium]
MKLKSKIILLVFLLIFNIQSFSFADEIKLNSEAAILVEISTGRILYEKNSTKKMYPASTTKILTAILVIENCKLDEIVTVRESALSNIPNGYVTCNLQIGEQLSVNDLLYALMIPSANDAAYVLAEYVAGSIDEFSTMMNDKARELGCKTTHFVNPNGIHDDSHYSTAYDLYLIADYAMKNDTFRKLVATTEYTLPATEQYPNEDRILKTTNELLNENSRKYYYKNAIGIKTGYTSKAGNCLVASSSRDGLEFIAVVLNGGTTNEGLNSRYIDSKKLFEYAYDNFTLTKIIEKGSIVQSLEIENGTKETKNLDLVIDKTITVVNNKSIDMNNVIPEITLKDTLEAPILAGEKIGTVKYKVEDIEYSANLLAKTTVEKIDYSIYLIIAGAILLVIAFSMIKSSRKKQKRKK